MTWRATLAVMAAVAVSQPALAACVDVAATGDWVEIPVSGPIVEVYAVGRWTAEDGTLDYVGPEGHDASLGARDGTRIAPPYAYGALLIASAERRVWDYESLKRASLGAMLAGQAMQPGPLFARINDTPDGLADNAGTVTLCIETASVAPGNASEPAADPATD